MMAPYVIGAQVFHSEKVLMKRSWEEADVFCRALGANLASFLHYEEEEFLKRTITNMFEGLVGGPLHCMSPICGLFWV